jgi:hypothetical protein
MASSQYKLIHIFFRDEKLTITLEININPDNKKDIKVKLKFLYEFKFSDSENNSLILIFEIVSDSLNENKISNHCSYLLFDENNDGKNDGKEMKFEIISLGSEEGKQNDDEYEFVIEDDGSDDEEYRKNFNTKKTIYNEEQDNQWIEHKTEHGHSYWWNKVTDESRWEKPSDLKPYELNSFEQQSTSSVKYKISNKNDDKNNDIVDYTTKIKQIKIEDKLIKLLKNSEIKHVDVIKEKILYHLRLTITMNNISPVKNIIFIITELIKFVNHFKITEEEKKSLIISSIAIFLESENYCKEENDFIVKIICPELIDILISIDKGKIKLQNKPVNCFSKPWLT